MVHTVVGMQNLRLAKSNRPIQPRSHTERRRAEVEVERSKWDIEASKWEIEAFISRSTRQCRDRALEIGHRSLEVGR